MVRDEVQDVKVYSFALLLYRPREKAILAVMTEERCFMRPLHLFLVSTFGLFLAGFALAGLLISFDGPGFLVVIVQIAMAWTPTFAYLIIHKRAHPETDLGSFILRQFAPRVRLLPLFGSILIPVIAGAAVWMGYSVVTGVPLRETLAELTVGSFGILCVNNLIRGPLGEELGWRGYLLGELHRRHSLVVSALIVGVIWGLWHLPLWLVSGYAGVDLLLYSLFFLISIVAFSVIISIVHVAGGRNLLYAIILHQMLNFTIQLVEIDRIIVLGGSAAFYTVLAVVLVLVFARVKGKAAAA